MTDDQETDRRLGLHERRECPAFSDSEFKRLLVAIDHIKELRHDVRCVKENIEVYKPMLDEMIIARENMTKVKLSVISAAAVGMLSILGSFGLFIAYLLWEWVRTKV